MDRARRAGLTALLVVVLLAASGGLAGIPVLAATVEWPVSALVVSEVQTGGASASDEFVELANQGSTAVDLAGLELVYATASGSTVTRKAAWDVATVLAPGRRLLLANAAGSLAAGADAAYSGGFAATGGALALRVIGGAVVDSVGWGDATSGFVEGTAGSAPPAGSSLERRPGGSDGNTIDTNDNASDWFVQGSPSPQGSASPPVPAPGPSILPSPSTSPDPTPTPTSTAIPSPSPTPTPTSTPTPSPTSTPTATPTASPTAPPSPTPTPSSTPTASPSPVPSTISIATARAVPDGTTVTVEGVLTIGLGTLESGRGGFVQDGSGGIAVYLDAPVAGSWPAGTTVVLRGAISNRFSQRTLRLAEAAIVRLPAAGIPAAIVVATGDAGEAFEGGRVSLSGTIIGSPGTLADGIGISLDDGSGVLRVVIGNAALAGQSLASGMTATIAGPLGQRDSSGTGSAGYRVHATLGGELVVAEPTATPDPSPTRDPDDSPSPDPTSEPTASPSASQGSGEGRSLATVRAMTPGTRVTVTAAVTAEDGRLGTPAVIALGDDSAGLAVRLPRGAGPFARGTLLQVSGTLADPYGQLEIRAATDGVRALGTGAVPIPIAAGTLDEGLEGRLVTVTGTLAAKPSRSSGGDITLVLERAGAAAVKVVADASSQIGVSAFTVGVTYRVTGIVGQRASRKGALDGYRLHPRDPGDLVSLPGPGEPPSSATPGGMPGATASPDPSSGAVIRIAAALGRADQRVAIEGTVTAPPTLLDATGRRIVVQDTSAAIELLLPGGVGAPPVGARIRAEGVVGLAYGAPRLRTEGLTILGTGPVPDPLVLRRSPGLAQEWRLVTLTGRIDDLRKLGDRWRAELLVAGSKVIVVGQPGAGIPAGALAEGRMAAVTGIVRRPYPTASDRRYSVLPRTRADLRVRGSTAAGSSSGSTATGPGRATGPRRSAGPAGSLGAASASFRPETVDADLVDLAAVVGQVVRVGGLIVELRPDGVLIDDGTTVGQVVLGGPALELLPLLEPDDAINAIGRVEHRPDGLAVVVDQPGGIVQAGEPVAPVATVLGDDPGGPVAGGADAPEGQGSTTDSGRQAGFLDGSAGFAGLGTLVVVSLASLAITVARRVATRRQIDRQIAARLATFGASAGPSPGPRSVERGDGTLG